MSHIHIPDGVGRDIWWLLLVSYAIVIVLLFFILKGMDREKVGKKVPLVGIMSAIMLITMSVPLGFIPFHLNLASLSGIIVGPALGFVAVFVVNLILAFMGHGGITVVGLNTLIIGLEVFLGSKLYGVFTSKWKKSASAAIATILALLISTVITFGVIFLITGESKAILHSHDHEGHDHEEHVYEEDDDRDHNHESHDHEDHDHEEETTHFLGYSGWAALSLVLIIGIALESVVSGLIVSFLSKVKPELIETERKH